LVRNPADAPPPPRQKRPSAGQQDAGVDLAALSALASMEREAVAGDLPVYAPAESPRRSESNNSAGPPIKLLAGGVIAAVLVVLGVIAAPGIMRTFRSVTSAARNAVAGSGMNGVDGPPREAQASGAPADAGIPDEDRFRDENGALTNEPPQTYTDGSISYTWVFNPNDDPYKQHVLDLFLPPRSFKRPVPCIFLTGAAGSPWTGNQLCKALQIQVDYSLLSRGFAICDYNTSGWMGSESNAITDFMASNGGMIDARRAIDFVTKASRAVDKNRFYAAGAGGAANLALRLLAEEPRIHGAIAICPWIDYEHVYAHTFKGMVQTNPAGAEFVRNTSPMKIDPHRFHGPLCLLATVPGYSEEYADTQQFADNLRAAGLNVEFRGATNGSLVDISFLGGAAEFGADFLKNATQAAN
jgi:hypothetical protein